MSTTTLTRHQPGTLTGFAGLCATGDCDHPGECQPTEVLACLGCTITDPNADSVPIVEWPCVHAPKAPALAVTLAVVLTPAVIRERLATSGCYGDGVTVPTEPCDHSADECAGAAARAMTDEQLTAAVLRLPERAPNSLEELAYDVLRLAQKAAQ